MSHGKAWLNNIYETCNRDEMFSWLCKLDKENTKLFKRILFLQRKLDKLEEKEAA